MTAAQRREILPHSLPPRGLSREEAARWVGVSPSTFDLMVAERRMPRPREIGARRVWDLRDLERFFDRLPYSGGDDGAPPEESGYNFSV